MQESSFENPYLSALSAHFVYWSSADVALLTLRAVHGLDVLTGQSMHSVHGAQKLAGSGQPAGVTAQPTAAAEGKSQEGQRGMKRLSPTSPRQHLVALP
jgi:hypothetical protein